MGLSYIQGTVRGPNGERPVRFLIDTIDPETLRRLANRADGLLVEGF